MAKKSYDDAYKLEVVLLVEELRLPLTQVAKRQGITPNTLHRWISKFKKEGMNAFGADKCFNPGNKVIRELRQQVKVLQEENKTLKQTVHLLTKN